LEKLLNPKSIAIVGASDNIGPGFNAWKALEHVGFAGQVYLVKPNKPVLFEKKTFPTLSEVPGDVDAVFVAVKAESVLEVAQQAAAKKAGGMAILSSGFGDAGEAGKKLQEELKDFSEKNNLSICGRCWSASKTALPALGHFWRGGINGGAGGSIGIATSTPRAGLGTTRSPRARRYATGYLEALVAITVKTVIVFAEQSGARGSWPWRGRPRKPASAHRAEAGAQAGPEDRVMAHTGAVAGAAEATRLPPPSSSAIRCSAWMN
jgi:hypothetical protein